MELSIGTGLIAKNMVNAAAHIEVLFGALSDFAKIVGILKSFLR